MWKSLRIRGVHWLHQAGHWKQDDTLDIPTNPPFSTSRKADKPGVDAWKKMWELFKDLKIQRCVYGDRERSDLLETRDQRRQKAEKCIRTIARRSPLKPSEVKASNEQSLWASDGSMRPAASGILESKTITCAITGPQTIAMRVTGQANSILHGELMGLVATLTISSAQHNGGKIFSDHLNTTRLISDHKAGGYVEAKLRHMPGRSFYRWLIQLVDENHNTAIEYTPGHATKLETPAARLNFEADHYASTASTDEFSQGLLIAPTPTFWMDEFTFHSQELGWIESNIKTMFVTLTDRNVSRSLSHGRQLRFAKWLYDPTPPPLHPYTRSHSAYSTAVQLYARSGQLPTADGLKQRKHQESNLCRMGCQTVEDVHHIFTICPSFAEYRTEARRKVVDDTSKLIDKEKLLEASEREKIMNLAESLFSDCLIWPLKCTQYYLGHIPRIDDHMQVGSVKQERLRHNLHSMWHLAAIRLAGRIWGEVQRRMAIQSNTRRKGYRP